MLNTSHTHQSSSAQLSTKSNPFQRFALAAMSLLATHTASAQHPAGPLDTKLDMNSNKIPDVVEAQREDGGLRADGQRGIQLTLIRTAAGVYKITAPLYHGQQPFMDIESTSNLGGTPFVYLTTLAADDPSTGNPYLDASGKRILQGEHVWLDPSMTFRWTASIGNLEAPQFFDGLTSVTPGYYRADVNGNITVTGMINLPQGVPGEVLVGSDLYTFVVGANGAWSITIPAPTAGIHNVIPGASTALEDESFFKSTVPVASNDPGNIPRIIVLGSNSDGKTQALTSTHLLTGPLAPNTTTGVRNYGFTLQPPAMASGGSLDTGVVTFDPYEARLSVNLANPLWAWEVAEASAQFGVVFLDENGVVVAQEMVGSATSLGSFGAGAQNMNFAGRISQEQLPFVFGALSPEVIRSMRPFVRIVASSASSTAFKSALGGDSGAGSVSTPLPSGPTTAIKTDWYFGAYAQAQ